MLRILLTILLPIVLPVVLYLAYVRYVRPQPVEGEAPQPAPLGVWIGLGVAALLVAGMLTLGFMRGVPPETKLISPHMENGEIVPSQRLDEEQ